MNQQRQPAQTLEEAVNTLNFLEPLEFPRDEAFYARRDIDPLGTLRQSLLTSEAPEKYLLIGQLGCGKSTELNRLKQDSDLIRKFHIVSFDAKDSLDPYDASYSELLFSLPSHLFASLKGMNISLPPELEKKIEAWRQSLDIKEIEETIDLSGEVSFFGRITAIFTGVEARAKSSASIRETVRKKVEPRISDLLEIFNEALSVGETALEKRALFIIDGLEKYPSATAKRIFKESGDLFARPRCKLLFTFPAHLSHPKDLQPIKNAFQATDFTISNYPVLNRDTLKPDNGVINFLINQVVARRADLGLFEEKALRSAALGSSGIITELIRALRDTCLYTLSKGGRRATIFDVEHVLANLRNNFKYLTEEEFTVLQRVKNDKRAPRDEKHLDLFYSLALVEYDTERWVYPNYLVLDLLKEKERKAVKKPATKPVKPKKKR